MIKPFVFMAFFISSALYAEEHVISQKNREFSKSILNVSEGDSVIFKNSDDITHNVYSVTDGCEFDLRVQRPGQESKIKFDVGCTAEVRCAIHPRMKMKVIVK